MRTSGPSPFPTGESLADYHMKTNEQVSRCGSSVGQKVEQVRQGKESREEAHVHSAHLGQVQQFLRLIVFKQTLQIQMFLV